MSEVWKHFKRDREKASCILCAKTLSCKGSSTSALINHLKHVHHLNITKKNSSCELTEGEPIAKKTVQPTDVQISNYFAPKETAASVLARCVAEDGMSVRAVQRSKIVASYMRSKGFPMPLSTMTIWKQINEFYNEKVEELKNHLMKLKRSHGRFSITVDEWTDISNHKYVNVSLRAYNPSTKTHEVYNLGLEEILREATAENIQHYVERKLNYFNLDFERDIVASTHDGASVMVKYGRQIPAFSQLCLNHAIHLCVVECFYSNRNDQLIHRSEQIEESDNDTSVSENSIVSEDDEEIIQLECNIEETLKKLRKCVKTFSKSNVKQKKLQEYILNEEGKEIRLCLDVKHRWNSMLHMITKFLKVHKCVNHALLDMGLSIFTEDEINSLEQISNLLEPLELAVNEFSKDSATLIEAEGIFKFLVNNVSKINSHHTEQLVDCLKRFRSL